SPCECSIGALRPIADNNPSKPWVRLFLTTAFSRSFDCDQYLDKPAAKLRSGQRCLQRVSSWPKIVRPEVVQAMKNRRSFATACISNALRSAVLLALQAFVVMPSGAQTHIPLQPFAQQVRQVETTLGYLGQPLSPADHQAINESIADGDEASAVLR